MGEGLTFGNYLRSARLGFHWHDGLKLFVRVAADGPPWVIQVVSNLPSTAKGEYRVWWEGESEWLTAWMLEYLGPLGKGVFCFDDEGQRV